MSAPLYHLNGDFGPYRSLFLEQSYHVRHIKAGNIVYESHTEWDSMMYLNSGTVKASIVQNDKEKLLAFYGEEYLIPYYIPTEFRISHPIQFTAVTDVTALQISKQEFEDILARHPQLSNEIYVSAWRLIHLLTHEVESQFFDSGLERVSAFLYSYFENIGIDSFEISTRDLQSFVGLNRTNLSKYLSFLIHAHVIEKERGVIKIVAPEKLKDFCSERVIRCDILPSYQMMHSMISDETKWNAIRSRDSTYDGVFWYGVKSTGIFCNPSCKSKPALKENVVYFDSPREALAAGYRACKRCRPDILSYNPNREVVKEVRDFLDSHFTENEITSTYLKELTKNSKQINKLFKMHYDVTPHAYVTEKRLEYAVQLLTQTRKNVLDVALASGFNSLSNFYSIFKNSYGVSPTKYRDSENVSEAVKYHDK